MKLTSLIHLMGFNVKPKHFPYEVVEYDIDEVGRVRYAQWKHPAESIKVMSTELVDRYREYIKEGDFCIDVGAHTGDTSLPMALAAGESGCLLALEPNPFVYPALEKMARANSRLANIKTIMAAAGLAEGFMEFEYSDSGFCNGGRHENIPLLKHGHFCRQTVYAVNLEDELRSDFAEYLPRLRFVKVDAEGFDLYVLRSIEGVIREYGPVIKAEVFDKADRQYRGEMLELFEGLDYTAYWIETEPFGKGDRLNRENLDVTCHRDILALPNGVVHRTS